MSSDQEASNVKLLESHLQLTKSIRVLDEVTNMQQTAKNYLRGHGHFPTQVANTQKNSAVNREQRARNSQWHSVSIEPANVKRHGASDEGEEATSGKKKPNCKLAANRKDVTASSSCH